MCGACGAAPALHWSAPFLATTPARSSAARAVTAIASRVGGVTVAATAAGYSVTTATGRCAVAADLGAVWAGLRRLRGFDGVPPAPPPRVASAGPATVPVVHGVAAAVDRRPTPLSLHRLPAVLAWLAGVDGRGPRGLRVRLGLTPGIDVAIEVRDGAVVRCTAVPAAGDGQVELDDPGGSFAEPLGDVLGPFAAGILVAGRG